MQQWKFHLLSFSSIKYNIVWNAWFCWLETQTNRTIDKWKEFIFCFSDDGRENRKTWTLSNTRDDVGVYISVKCSLFVFEITTITTITTTTITTTTTRKYYFFNIFEIEFTDIFQRKDMKKKQMKWEVNFTKQFKVLLIIILMTISLKTHGLLILYQTYLFIYIQIK